VTKIKQLGNFAIGVGSAKRDLGRDLCNWKRPWALKSDARERKRESSGEREIARDSDYYF
jgi:hypothetical protein